MKTKINLIAILFLLTSTVIPQTQGKAIVIGKIGGKVPEGKYWKLETAKTIPVELSEGSFKSGSLCNAMLFSKPNVVFYVSTGSIYRADKSYAIIFEGMKKIPYSNGVSYEITPKRIVTSDFDFKTLAYKDINSVGVPELIFMPGTFVFANQCIENIQLFEYTLTKDVITKIEKEQSEKQKTLELNEKNESDQRKLKQVENLNIGLDVTGDPFNIDGRVTNRKEIEITKTEKFSQIMIKYFNETSERNPEYKQYLANNVSGTGKGSYLYNLRFCFDESGKLYRVIDNVKKQGSKYAEYTDLPKEYIDELKNEIVAKTPGIFEFENKKYPVKFYNWFRFNFSIGEMGGTTYLSFKKDKKGEIEVIEYKPSGYSKFNQSMCVDMIKKSEGFLKASKGKYSVKIQENYKNSSITVFSDYTQSKETFPFTDKRVEIIDFKEM
ncbi:MAG: hypothetical protein JST26_11355 [Bacteroidetes bacterium]|nr:hypothetical protein [Bacteroidota bacterium]